MEVSAPQNSLAPAIVMLFGTFHFAFPANDFVKNQIKNILTDDSQVYLESLALRINKFNPTAVLLEYDQKDNHKFNDLYSQYLTDEYRLGVNEIDQLGFRIAKVSGLNQIHGFDERDIPWDAEKLFEQLKREPALEKRFNSNVLEMTKDESGAHTSLSLQELFQRYNSPEMDRKNKSLYLATNVVGVDSDFAGADAAASWWHRNFRMFARIQKFAQPGEKLLVIAGQGHTAVLRDLLKLDSNLKSEDISSYL